MQIVLTSYILVYLLKLIQFLPAAAGAAFVVLWINQASKKDQGQGRLEKLFMLLSMPFFLTVASIPVVPALSHFFMGVTVFPPFLDLVKFAGASVLAAGVAVALLRKGVQVLDKAKGKATVTSERERNKKTDVREILRHIPEAALEFNPVPYFDIKKGVFLGLGENGKPVYISFGGGTSAPHVQVVGTTGAGKGVSLGIMASQFLMLKEAVFFCDPKNDEWAPSVMYGAAKVVGRPYYFVNLNPPAGPQINLFEGTTREEAFELFQAGLGLTDKGDASDFYGIEDRFEAMRVSRLIAEGGLTPAEAFEMTEENFEIAKKFYGKLRELAGIPAINCKSGGVSIEKVIADGGCVYVVGSTTNDLVKMCQRILLVRINQLAKRRDRMKGEVRKICVLLDEVKYHISRIALEGLGTARDKGVHFVLAHQSLGDLKDCPKDINPDAVVDAIVENCKIKICYRVQSPVTAEWLAAMSGKILVDDETKTINRNLALSETVDGARSIRQAERYYVDENMLLNLQPQVSVLYGVGLPKFVSIQPIKLPKQPNSIKIVEGVGKSYEAVNEIDIDMPDDEKPVKAVQSWHQEEEQEPRTEAIASTAPELDHEEYEDPLDAMLALSDSEAKREAKEDPEGEAKEEAKRDPEEEAKREHEPDPFGL